MIAVNTSKKAIFHRNTGLVQKTLKLKSFTVCVSTLQLIQPYLCATCIEKKVPDAIIQTFVGILFHKQQKKFRGCLIKIRLKKYPLSDHSKNYF